MILETERLILRPWREDEAEGLYEYASDPRVGPAAGWPVHTSVEDSLRVIRDIFSDKGAFAVTRKGNDRAIGSVGMFPTTVKDYPTAEGETEIGYWIAVPYWGQGLIPEAVRELLRICFEEKGENRVWCGHYEVNDKSRRVVEKCGFKFMIKQEVDVPLLEERRVQYYYSITKEDWQNGR